MRFRIVAILLLLVVSAALPLLGQTINGCVDTNKGTLRIVKPGEPCDAKEYAVSWNKEGVAGKDGKDGTNGINGANGLNGTDGRDGRDCEPAPTPAPAQIGTLTINGVPGGPYPVFQFSGGVTMTPPTIGGGGGGAGRADFSDVTIVRKVDAASPILFESLATGEHISDVVINLIPGTAGPRSMKLHDVLLTRYEFIRLPGSNDLFETVSFNYSRIEFRYDGVVGCYDLKMARPC